MRWFATVQNSQYTSFVIEKEKLKDIMRGPDMDAFSLYVYKDDKVVADEMQDTLDTAMQQALEDYGVPLDAWAPVEGPYHWHAEIQKGLQHRVLQCGIHHDLLGGYYLFVAKDGVPVDTRGKNKRYRQDSLDEIKQVALEDYGVPLDAWQVVA